MSTSTSTTTDAAEIRPMPATTTCLRITPLDPDALLPAHRTGTLTHLSEGNIIERLGFLPLRHSVEGKSDQEWRFRVGEHDCAIWDAKGSGRHGVWSTFGPAEVFTSLFGWRAVR
jgi:hypothetical protein